MDTLEKLLLLEFLVDSVYYEKTAIDPRRLQGLADTNVRFQFLDYPPVDISEVDFCPTGDGYERSEISFKSGKSILFALPDLTRGIGNSFDIFVTVSRKIKKSPGGLHDLGKTVIRLGESFVNLLETTSYEGVCPTSRTVRDSYTFSDENGKITGLITAFIRLSCFGKIIVTQFQGEGLAERSYCFKGGEDEAVPQVPPEVEDSVCGGYGGNVPQMMMGPPMPPPMIPQTINIPVPLKKKQPLNKCGKVPSELVSSDSEGEQKGPYCLRKDCPKHYQRPPWIAGAKRAKRTIAGPPTGAAAFQGDDVLFQMRHPLNGNSAQPPKGETIFHLDNEPDQHRQKVQMIEPDVRPEHDNEHDVFLLRFGKRDAQNKPAKLIVALKTPKVQDFTEHKCRTDQYIQTECAKKSRRLQQANAAPTAPPTPSAEPPKEDEAKTVKGGKAKKK
ncbi:hypothetical protein O3M35_012981 [Rhynocoris fuscipes]|uniref:Uncharacterized protein n=1 Tax=Rhynocoris fuscipes TaxID=488301 RepID=A0AAW1CJ35_9HEMI